MRSLQHPVTRVLVALVALVLLALPAVTEQPPAAAQATSPSPATVLGARWLANQLTPEGYVEGLGSPDPDPDATRDVAFTLAATGLERSAFEAVLAWIRTNVEEVIAPDDGPDEAGALAYLIMLALAVGEDPRGFGGVDLIARLEALYGLYEVGLYEESDPTYNGVFRQSLALLALDTAGVTPPPGAITWLHNQQCVTGASDPASVGGFPNYRDPAVACPAPDNLTYSGAEVDATAMALQYLVASEGPTSQRSRAAADFLVGSQSPDGGFPWYLGGENSPNSTAIAIGALAAVGEQGPARSAITWLVAQQLDCNSPDAGAFTSSYSAGAADQYATRQAVLGVAGVILPLQTPVWATAPDPCTPPGSSPEPSIAVAGTTIQHHSAVAPKHTG